MNRTNPPPLSFPQRIENRKLPGREGNAAMVAETVTDEVRVQEDTQTEGACTSWEERHQSLKAGGKILTFNPLAPDSPQCHGPSCSQGLAKAWRCKHFRRPP
ncbi:hypothetical protein QTO34_007910 [Cnephaeus nilssonii]|uniref:Large ribosomal subunit protein uL15/eL18 domain-containing protein n=1 Tax=Cnephaeus nilssonii TaxID=3371016 RepID=A0AA40I9E4_CNENI|nr:hypothetical protein QTO34_007910 [Eptesicus nilssonii]